MAAPATLASLRHRLAHIDNEIERTELKLCRLATSREYVVSELKKIAYPGILTLPRELTEEIFVQVVTRLRIGGPKPELGPLILASVCRAWRRIALSHSAIWCKLVLAQKQKPTYPLLGHPDSCVCYSLERARKLAVILPIIIGYAARWTRFEWFGGEGDNIAPLFRRYSPALTNLRELLLDEALDSDITFFDNAPALRNVSLFTFAFGDVLPWAQITTLCCAWLDVHSAFEILEQTINVEDLTLLLVRYDDADTLEPPDTLTLRSVSRLSVDLDDNDTDMAGLDQLILPCLQHLEVRFCPATREWCADKIVLFLKASKCALLSLSIENTTTDCVIRLLRRTPALVELKIQQLLGFRPGRIISHIISSARRGRLTSLRILRVEVEAMEMPYNEISQLVDALKAREQGDWWSGDECDDTEDSDGDGESKESDSQGEDNDDEDASSSSSVSGSSDTSLNRKIRTCPARRHLQLREVSFFVEAIPSVEESKELRKLAGMGHDEWPLDCDFSIVGPHNIGIQSMAHPVGSLSKRVEMPRHV
ncbi:F-box domain-containing protein [Mycena kentingensis (nom. inval.)]|nr:F-box domain-containing protein [Mycena kentingensis (nom. inval.)]